MRIRIIPATISIAILMLCVRVVDMTHGTEALAQQADTPAKTDAAAPAKPAESPAAKDEKKDADKKDADKKEGDKKEDEKKDEKKDEDKKEGEKKETNPNVSESPGDIVDHRYTTEEVDLLQNLVRRREELDLWEKNIQIKEAALDATEKRVDDKITQIDSMKKEVSELLDEYNQKEDAKIRSLVKIYESMKPKDAARIFDEVEMPILLLVIDKMSEKKTAPILALMDPKKAKAITVQLAEQRKVGSVKMNNIAPATAGTSPPPSASAAAAAAPATATPTKSK